MKELKRDIAANRYDVDSALVAEAILNKLRLVRRGREALGSAEGGRSRPLAARGPRAA